MIAKTIVAAGALAAALFGLQSAALAQAPSFDSFVKSYYDADYAAHPVAATRAGIHDYDAQVDDMTAEGQAREIARLHAALATLTAIAPTSLSAKDRDDREVLIGTIKGALLDDETIQYWR